MVIQIRCREILLSSSLHLFDTTLRMSDLMSDQYKIVIDVMANVSVLRFNDDGSTFT